MAEENTNLITFGDEVVATSEITLAGLHLVEGTSTVLATLVHLSRDGSRRVVRTMEVQIVNTIKHPDYATNPISTHFPNQRWEGIRYLAINLPKQPGQKLLLWNRPSSGSRLPRDRAMVGMYVPYGVANQTTLLSDYPVNPYQRCREMREEIATIAHGWDWTWHGRYVFSDHLRQQLTSQLVDGLLAYAEGQIAAYLAATTDPENDTTWKTRLTALEAEVKVVCGICTGDPTIWPRRIARNLDLHAFRARMDAGEIPKPITTTDPWTPGVAVRKLAIPSTVTITSERRELAARWHEANRAIVEGTVLRYYDEDMQIPKELEYGYDIGHEHDPI